MPRLDWEDADTGEDRGPKTDFDFIRTLDGHLGVNVETDPDQASDFDWRRNTHAARHVEDPRHSRSHKQDRIARIPGKG